MKKHKLPIELDVFLTTDCRIQERLAIIQTSKHSMAWISTHLDIFMDDDLSIGFGTSNSVANLNYYDDILLTKDLNLWESIPNRIIDIVIENINHNNYIIIDLYWGSKYKVATSYNKTYSVLVYGYDEENEIFYITGLDNNKYIESQISFSELKDLYSDAYDVYKNDTLSKVFRQYFNYPLTSIKLVSEVSEDNSIYNAIVLKLGKEEAGYSTVMEQYDSCENKTVSFKRYTGINCLIGIKDFMSRFDESCLPNSNDLEKLHKSLYQLYEHRKVILCTMKWINKIIGDNSESLDSIIYEYQDLVESIRTIYDLSGKLIIKKEKNIVDRLIDKVTIQYKKEKETLINFIGESLKLYTNFSSYNYHIKHNSFHNKHLNG